MTRLNSLKTSIVGDIDNIGSERYFVTVACFAASIFLMLLCAVHLIMNLKTAPVFYAGLSSIIIMGLYFLVRFGTCLFIPKLLLTVLGLIMVDFTWYSKYLSNGPVLFFVFIFGALILWVWEGKALALLLSFYFLNIVVLFLIDYNTPSYLLAYQDNNMRMLDIYLSLFLYSSLLIFLLYVVKRDFIRQASKAIESDKLKSAFLANMSHEIRTPMNAIIGFSELLENEDKPEIKLNYINIIKNSSESLMKLIDDIIDLSKIESGSLQINISEFSINKLFHELKEIYTVILIKKDKTEIQLDFELPGEDFIICSDEFRIKQVLSNLLNNSIKFTSHGKISMHCSRKGPELIFSVSDTGTGIPVKDQIKIFDRFSKFNYKGMNIEGSGIGLSIVEKILGLLNGRIWMKSEWGAGSTFYFSIPFVPSKCPLPAIETIKNTVFTTPEAT